MGMTVKTIFPLFYAGIVSLKYVLSLKILKVTVLSFILSLIESFNGASTIHKY